MLPSAPPRRTVLAGTVAALIGWPWHRERLLETTGTVDRIVDGDHVVILLEELGEELVLPADSLAVEEGDHVIVTLSRERQFG